MMAIAATDIAALQQYAQGVMGRANHHAGNVQAIALALLGGIIWRGEPGSIRLRQYDGKPANMLWVTIRGTVYAFVYNHAAQVIEIRDRTQSGAILHSFNDQTPTSTVEAVFKAL